MVNLSGKVALVTGASRGIGKAIALYLADLGARVAVNYANSEEEARNVVEAIQRNGGQAILVQGDVSSSSDVEALVDRVIEEWGTIDILVNNAGINRDTLLMRMKEEDWDKVININLKGVYNCTRAVSRIMMKKRYGKIINISSIVGVVGNAGQANYAAAKAGIIGFSKSVAKELASRNVQVNVIAPGFIETDMTSTLSDSVKQNILSQIPVGRYGKAEEVAYLAGFLASDLSQYITGQVIHVDGGMIM